MKAPTTGRVSSRSQRRPISVGRGSRRQHKQPAAVNASQHQPAPAGASQRVSQPGKPDRQTDRDRAAREPSQQLGWQRAASQIASQLIRQVGSHVAAAASLQQAVFFGALLCSTSPPAETRLTVYRRSQHSEPSRRRVLRTASHVGTGGKPST